MQIEISPVIEVLEPIIVLDSTAAVIDSAVHGIHGHHFSHH